MHQLRHCMAANGLLFGVQLSSLETVSSTSGRPMLSSVDISLQSVKTDLNTGSIQDQSATMTRRQPKVNVNYHLLSKHLHLGSKHKFLSTV